MKPEEDPDVQLMLAVKRDDVEAFETLFYKYAHPLVNLAVAFVRSRARAEEIAQETFVQVYKSRHRYEPTARFATWLYRIATNLCLSETRRAEHRLQVRPVSPTDPDGEGWDPDAVADPTAVSSEEAVLARERTQEMMEALQELPPKQRAALLLARAEGFSYEEVARTLGCSVSAVKSLVHRATVTLRERVVEVGNG